MLQAEVWIPSRTFTERRICCPQFHICYIDLQIFLFAERQKPAPVECETNHDTKSSFRLYISAFSAQGHRPQRTERNILTALCFGPMANGFSCLPLPCFSLNPSLGFHWMRNTWGGSCKKLVRQRAWGRNSAQRDRHTEAQRVMLVAIITLTCEELL